MCLSVVLGPSLPGWAVDRLSGEQAVGSSEASLTGLL